MRVLLIATTGIGPVDIGGPSTVAQFLTKYLVKNGIEITLLIRGSKNKVVKLKSTPPYDRLPVNIKNIDYDWGTLSHPIKLAKTLFMTYYWYLKEIEKYDVIIYNAPPTDILIVFPIISKIFSKRQIFIIHGGIFYEINSIYGKFGRNILKVYRSIFDIIVGVSPVSVEVAYSSGFPRNRIKQIFNGIDFEIMTKIKPISQNKKAVKILYLGRLSQIKRVGDLILATHKILSKYKDVEISIIGDGPIRDYLKRLTEHLRIDEHIHFTGPLPTIEGYKYIKSASIFILPSEKENFPMTILEAMALKTPIIASDIEGTKYTLINEKNALIFTVGDINELSRHIERLMLNPKLRKKFSTVGYRIVKKRYDWEIVVKKYLALIQTRPEG